MSDDVFDLSIIDIKGIVKVTLEDDYGTVFSNGKEVPVTAEYLNSQDVQNSLIALQESINKFQNASFDLVGILENIKENMAFLCFTDENGHPLYKNWDSFINAFMPGGKSQFSKLKTARDGRQWLIDNCPEQYDLNKDFPANTNFYYELGRRTDVKAHEDIGYLCSLPRAERTAAKLTELRTLKTCKSNLLPPHDSESESGVVEEAQAVETTCVNDDDTMPTLPVGYTQIENDASETPAPTSADEAHDVVVADTKSELVPETEPQTVPKPSEQWAKYVQTDFFLTSENASEDKGANEGGGHSKVESSTATIETAHQQDSDAHNGDEPEMLSSNWEQCTFDKMADYVCTTLLNAGFQQYVAQETKSHSERGDLKSGEKTLRHRINDAIDDFRKSVSIMQLPSGCTTATAKEGK